MKALTKLFLFLLAAALLFSLASCGNGVEDDNNADGGGDGGDTTVTTPPEEEEDDPENLVLIQDSKAKFRVVLASGVDGSTRKSVENFISDLQKIGVEVDKYYSDSVADGVADCEIIVGTGVKNRDSKYVLNARNYGEEGYVIKVVDNKLLIGGGNALQTKTAFEYFVKNVIKLTSKTKEIDEFKLERTYERLKETKYLIDSITVADTELSEFVFVSNVNNNDYPVIKNFRENLYKATGYWLETAKAGEIPEGKKVFSVNLVENAGDTGFRAFVDSDGNFVVECAYSNAINDAFENLAKTQIYDKLGDVTFGKSYEKTYPVNVVYYSQFGAKGDGLADDFEAMYNTHVFANQCGQKVMGDAGYRYYVHVFYKTIPVQTDVDFNGATIHLNDKGSEVYKGKDLHLFTFTPSYEVKSYTGDQIQEMSGGAPILTTDTEVPWLVPYLEATSFVRIENKHADYIRHGGNAGYYMNRRDVFVIDADGKMHEDTPVYFDFEEGEQLINDGVRLHYLYTRNIESMKIYRVDEKPITMENGFFERDACESVSETGYENKYHAYARGLGIQRSNVTVKNVHHKLISEPYLPTSGYGYYDSTSSSIRQSYPYYGFLAFLECYNSKAVDVDLWAHTTYYEIKTTNPTPVPMGSYDLTIRDCSNISLYGLTNGQDYNDTQYWGIMSSYGAKNLHFEGCHMNRFDAHDGFWNAKLIDCEFGFNINVVGGGNLYIENTTKNVGMAYIDLRSDYGAPFKGDLTIINGVLFGNKPYRGADSADYGKAYEEGTVLKVVNAGFLTKYVGKYEEGNAGAAPYLKWDFGYTCYMPQNVVIDNFKVANPDVKIVLYNSIDDAAFIKPNNFIQPEDWQNKQIKLTDGTYRPMTEDDIYYNQYQITKSVVYKNMQPLPPCDNVSLYMYRYIDSITTIE